MWCPYVFTWLYVKIVYLIYLILAILILHCCVYFDKREFVLFALPVKVLPEKRTLKILKSQSINVNWYIYCPETAVLVLSTTVQGNVLQPFAFKVSNVYFVCDRRVPWNLCLISFFFYLQDFSKKLVQ